jgi:hypothetical protein
MRNAVVHSETRLDAGYRQRACERKAHRRKQHQGKGDLAHHQHVAAGEDTARFTAGGFLCGDRL